MPSVLLVDPDRGLAELLRIALVREGFAVETSTRAEEAMSRLHSEHPNIVVIDVGFAGAEGRDLLAEVSSRPDTVGILLTKPFSHHELAKRLRAKFFPPGPAASRPA